MDKKRINDWFAFFAPRYYVLTAVVGIIIRIMLILSPYTSLEGFTAVTWLRIFGIGLLNDLAFNSIALIPAFLLYSFMTDVKYRKPWGYILAGLLTAFTLYVLLCNDITDEYAGVVPGIANALLSVITVCFLIKLFVPAVRETWRRVFIAAVMLAYFFGVMFFNLIGENVFWSEFSVRYNFIAVDYLVYTNEVIGNIWESYPMIPIILGVIALAAGIYWLFTRKRSLRGSGIADWKHYFINLFCLGVLASVGFVWLHWGYRNLCDRNSTFATELQENGCWNFLEAYNSNELSYSQFYEMIDKGEAKEKVYAMNGWNEDGILEIRDDAQALKKNIVLITMESLSAEFLETFGNGSHITPNLDSLAGRSLCFDNFFATGNRTVRGLEAVTLCIPPSAGESIVKRPDNGGLYTTGSILRDMGYSTTYIYGGDSYFDNMEAFFGGNGYDILDKKNYGAENITFANIWGTCDEDSYGVALKHFDAEAESGRPFFGHIMTISNHRPYTYPEGRIEYEGNPMSRSAAVKYTDWCIGDFLSKAATRPWFDDTVFIILADHCASSAGKTSLPLEGYHIPAMVYAPGFIEPQRVEKLCSQIDLMPTVFSLLHFSYGSRFYGRDILSPDYRERAFMATYQDLGYYADGILTVLSPVRMVRQYKVTRHDGWRWEESPVEEPAVEQLAEAQAYYQSVNGANN